MDQNINAHGSTRLSILTAAISMALAITPGQVAFWIGLCSGIIAMGSGIMAIRYYYYATKKLKQ